MKIEITMEKVQRVAMKFDATEEQLQLLNSGKNPFGEVMKKELPSGDVAYDYAVTDEDGETLIGWR